MTIDNRTINVLTTPIRKLHKCNQYKEVSLLPGHVEANIKGGDY